MSDEINLERIYKTREICSCSGQYAIVDEKGIVTEREITMVRGNQFPPPRGRQGYILKTNTEGRSPHTPTLTTGGRIITD